MGGLLPRNTGHICAASGIVALPWARPQSVNRSGAKKLAINQAAAKRPKSQLVRAWLTRGLDRSARQRKSTVSVLVGRYGMAGGGRNPVFSCSRSRSRASCAA